MLVLNLYILEFDIVSDLELRISSLWRTFSTEVENIRQINLFMQNKPNFLHFSLKNEDFTEKQTQSKPILAQKSGWQSQFKPNSKPILGQKSGWQTQTNPMESECKSP